MTQTFKTLALVALLGVLFVAVGSAVGGRGGATFAFLLAALFNLGAWFWSDRIVLAMHRAKELAPETAPDLHRVVEALAAGAGIPKPRLYLVEEAQPNAFATGRNPAHGAIAVTAGLLRAMDRAEIEGVLAHEIAHIRNRDVLLMTVAGVFAAAIAHMASMARWAMIFGGRRDDDRGGNPFAHLFVVLFAGMAAMLVRLAISRSREYAADAAAVRIVGNPLGLMRALEKLGRYTQTVPMDASPATAHMMIANPFAGAEGGIAALFSSHPPIPERIRRLQASTE